MERKRYNYRDTKGAPSPSKARTTNVKNEEQKLTKSTDPSLRRVTIQNRPCRSCDAARFQDWLLEEGTHTTPSQEGILRRRYLEMIYNELDNMNKVPERRSILYMKKDPTHLNCPRNQRELRRQIEEEWKSKDMVILNKIRDDIRRQTKLEEQRRLQKEMNQKKLAFQQKKKAYYSKKTQSRESKRQASAQMKEQNEQASNSKIKSKTNITNDQKTSQGHAETKESIPPTESNTKTDLNSPPILSPPQPVSETNTIEPQADKEIETPNPVTTSEITTPMMCVPRDSLPTTSGQTVRPAHLHKEKTKKQSNTLDSVRERLNRAPPASSHEAHTSYCQDHQVKITSEELHSIIQNIMTLVVTSVANILYPVITKYDRQ